jgi:hypothetical protein
MEQLLIKKIQGGINAIKGGRKSPKEAGLGTAFKKLKDINEPMYDDLIEKYKSAVAKYKEENE